MKAYQSLLVLAAGIVAGPVSAQTTNCQWVGSIWTCQAVGGANQPNPLRSLNNPSDIGNQAMQAFERGRQQRESIERARLERERLQAERDYYQRQTAQPYSPPANLSGASEPRPLSDLIDPPYGNLTPIVPQPSFVAPLTVRQKIGELLKAGECTAGTNMALEAGDIELAKNVRDFCSDQK